MPHFRGVPIQSRAIILRDRAIRQRNDKLAIAGRFSRVKNAKALSAIARAGLNTRKKSLVKGGVIRLKNRSVPR